MNNDTINTAGYKYSDVSDAMPPLPDADVSVALKMELNNIIWMRARKDVTLEQAENAACAAFEAIWPLCTAEGHSGNGT